MLHISSQSVLVCFFASALHLRDRSPRLRALHPTPASGALKASLCRSRTSPQRSKDSTLSPSVYVPLPALAQSQSNLLKAKAKGLSTLKMTLRRLTRLPEALWSAAESASAPRGCAPKASKGPRRGGPALRLRTSRGRPRAVHSVPHLARCGGSVAGGGTSWTSRRGRRSAQGPRRFASASKASRATPRPDLGVPRG